MESCGQEKCIITDAFQEMTVERPDILVISCRVPHYSKIRQSAFAKKFFDHMFSFNFQDMELQLVIWKLKASYLTK